MTNTTVVTTGFGRFFEDFFMVIVETVPLNS
jgi:hypothetical protein